MGKSLLKGVVMQNHVQDNKFTLTMVGMIPITVITLGGIEEEMDASDTPDRSHRSGGRTKPVAFDITTPMHHVAELKAMELWFRQGKDPISPLHRKVGAIVAYTQSGLPFVKYTLLETWIEKRGLPEFDLGGDGAVQFITWGMSADEVLPTM